MNDSVRIALTVDSDTAKELKQTGVDFNTPAAVISRALVEYGLDRIGRDPYIQAAVTDAVAVEHERRRAAGVRGCEKRWGATASTKKD